MHLSSRGALLGFCRSSARCSEERRLVAACFLRLCSSACTELWQKLHSISWKPFVRPTKAQGMQPRLQRFAPVWFDAFPCSPSACTLAAGHHHLLQGQGRQKPKADERSYKQEMQACASILQPPPLSFVSQV
mmetsp:Transcript_51059/g.105547  ORF Transcript_51059/g.105547 Transcript_51059/m.105547 type:complete len:132 (+) Transcript_51059:157-552(+)